MTDFLTHTQRSDLMSRVRSRGNKATELALIEVFRSYGITGWRRNIRLFGRPDFVFAEAKLAVFVDGCFWHGCPKHRSQPATNFSFWEKKLGGNLRRDRLVTLTLRKGGWRVARIWHHELRKGNESRLLARLGKLGLRSSPKRLLNQ